MTEIEEISVKRDNCLVCNKEIFDSFWLYVWKGKQGYCCEPCGLDIHVAGYKILDSISNLLLTNGCTIYTNKEKFGSYRLSVMAPDKKRMKLANRLFKQATKDFPEFSFIFDVFVETKHD